MVEREELGAPPLLSPLLRPFLLGAGALCAAVAVVLGVRYRGQDHAARLDHWMLDGLPWAVPVRSRTLSLIADLTDTQAAALAAILLTAFLCWRRRWALAALAAVGPGSTGLVTWAGKHMVHRHYYDDPTSLAYPSGHTAGVTAVLLVVALAVLGRLHDHLLPAAVGALLAVTAAAAAVGLTMVLLGGHYPTDVVAGYCTAVAVTAAAAEAVDVAMSRRRP